MKQNIQILFLAFFLLITIEKSYSQSQSSSENKRPIPPCSKEEAPYRDFDFVVGEWEMFDKEGVKVGEQVYVKREKGCLITEEWTTVAGGTGHGMTFVDSETGLWRQVYVSPLGQIDYSGGIDENGSMVLEGTLHPTDGRPSAPIRGIWTKQEDGSMKEEFLIFNSKTKNWMMFYFGIARKKQ